MFYYGCVGGSSYAELHAHSAFTFLEGAATPRQLVQAGVELGLSALAIIDIDGMYSAIQSSQAGKTCGLPIIHGAEFTLSTQEWEKSAILAEFGNDWRLPNSAEDPGIRVPILARNPAGYRDLCSALSAYALNRPGEREYAHRLADLADSHNGNWLILTGSGRGVLRRSLQRGGIEAASSVLERLIDYFGADALAVESTLTSTDPPELADALAHLATKYMLPLVATSAARVDLPRRSAIADVLTATRLHGSLSAVEGHMHAGGEFLRSPAEMLHIHRRHPHAVHTAGELGAELAFDMSLIAPGLPTTRVPEGHNDATWLRHLAYEGAQRHYGSRAEHPRAWETIDHELGVIEYLDFPGYFLIVKDIVDFCRRSGIWCQGRGSAANSAVCYALGITAVDAVRHRMLFERFLSDGRSGPPDIDIDIESDRREEVIQYVYDTYGRENAAQVATVLTYRPRSAIYDAARALGHDEERSRAWAQRLSRWMWNDGVRSLGDYERSDTGRGQPGGLAQESAVRVPVPDQVLSVAAALQDLPRHTGVHSGGMVLTRTPVSQVCPVRWAAMPGRTVLQWDKDDCADAGLVKFDLLGLGMLSALRRAFTWIEKTGERAADGSPYGLHHLPPEDPAVYDLLCAADAIGVFQVESRAQLNTLPRLQPRCFYDLVIEVALIRPGPIQGQSVNPYLRRRRGEEEITYPHPLLKPALEKTLGVPLFQEQLMQIAIDVAGFSAGEADELRRAMGAKRSAERMEALRPRLLAGMAKRGVVGDVAEGIIDKLHAFSDFGFPESHSFSFAFLVYASAWLKVHYPEFFYAGIIASQPMGFYSVSTLVHDARRHGVQVERPDVNYSDVLTCVRHRNSRTESLETARSSDGQAAPSSDFGERRWQRNVHLCCDWEVRLGLDQVKGLPHQAMKRIVEARQDGPFLNVNDCAARAGLNATTMEILAKSGALSSLSSNRRDALWLAGQVGARVCGSPDGQIEEQLILPGLETVVDSPGFAHMSTHESVLTDYATMSVSPLQHPFASYRAMLEAQGIRPASSVRMQDAGSIVEVAGVVTHRQSPATGKGVVFLSLEDETGLSNITCSVGMWKRYRHVGTTSPVLRVRGMVEHGHGAISILAHHLEAIPGIIGTGETGRGGF